MKCCTYLAHWTSYFHLMGAESEFTKQERILIRFVFVRNISSFSVLSAIWPNKSDNFCFSLLKLLFMLCHVKNK